MTACVKKNECFSSNSDATHDLCPGRQSLIGISFENPQCVEACNRGAIVLKVQQWEKTDTNPNNRKKWYWIFLGGVTQKESRNLFFFFPLLGLRMRLISIWHLWKVWNISNDSCNHSAFDRWVFMQQSLSPIHTATPATASAIYERMCGSVTGTVRFFSLSHYIVKMSLYRWNDMNLI